MNRKQKNEEIDLIKDCFDRIVSAVLLNFQGITVEHATQLREAFRKAGVEYKVVKNKLVKQALKEQPYEAGLHRALTGMTGTSWSDEEPSVSVKIIKDFKQEKALEHLRIKAGVIEGTILEPQEVEEKLLSMPGKDELRSMFLSVLQAPMQ